MTHARVPAMCEPTAGGTESVSASLRSRKSIDGLEGEARMAWKVKPGAANA